MTCKCQLQHLIPTRELTTLIFPPSAIKKDVLPGRVFMTHGADFDWAVIAANQATLPNSHKPFSPKSVTFSLKLCK